jgi:hypothetical protein
MPSFLLTGASRGLVAVAASGLLAIAGASDGFAAAPPRTLAAIVAAIERNKGLCCKIGVVKVSRIALSRDRRFAVASAAGGNALEAATVILWHGASRWAVVEYGTDVRGCGFVPLAVIDALVSHEAARVCPNEIKSDPFFHGSDAAMITRVTKSDPWLADPDRGEHVADFRLLMPISKQSWFAVVAVHVTTRAGRAVKFGLLRRGTVMWSTVDVSAGLRGVGCGLVPDPARGALGLTGTCKV